MITAEQATKRYLQNSVEAFLQGAQNENWIMGVIGASATPESLQEALQFFSSAYQNTERFQFLKNAYATA